MVRYTHCCEIFINPACMFPLFQCFIKDAVDDSIRDMRVCSEMGGTVAFPKDMPPYPFGVDPVWHGTKSELPFLNSMKMKMSILLGVVHMNLGIMMSLFNNLYFRDRLSTICEFIPQVRLLGSGQLSAKWTGLVIAAVTKGSAPLRGLVPWQPGCLEAGKPRWCLH